MEFETVIYKLEGTVATVTMNRPDALNALSLQLTTDLGAAIRQAIEDGARGSRAGGLGGQLGRDQRAKAPRTAPIHHVETAADGPVPGQEDHDARAAALRGH